MAGIFGIIGENIILKDFEKDHQLASNYSKDTELLAEKAFFGVAGLNFKNNKIFSKNNLIIAIYGGFYTESTKISDSAQTIYELYNKYNDDFIHKLDGSFNIFIYDKNSDQIKIYNDWAGNHFLFYAIQDSKLIFSSEFKPIINYLNKKTIDKDAIVENFMFGHNLKEKTLIKEIKLLPAGSVLTFNSGTIDIKKYFDLKDSFNPIFNNKAALSDKLYDLFETATLKHLNKKQVSLPLTGGMDSRFLLHFILKTNFNLADTFTLGTKEDEDVRIASSIANKYNLPHRVLTPEVNSFKDIIDDYYIYDGFMGTQLYGQSQKKILEKDLHYFIQYTSADGVLGNRYTPRTKSWMENPTTSNKSLEIIINEFIKLDESLINSLFLNPSGIYENNIQNTVTTYSTLNNHPTIFSFEYFLFYEHVRRMNNLGLYSKYVDRLTPSHDRELLKFCSSLPLEMKYFQYLYKYMFKKRCPDLAKFAREGTGIPISSPESLQVLFKFLNKKVIKRHAQNSRSKSIEYFFKELFINEIEEILLSTKSKERGIFNTETIKKILFEYKSGKNRSYLIHQLLSVEIFFLNNFD